MFSLTARQMHEVLDCESFLIESETDLGCQSRGNDFGLSKDNLGVTGPDEFVPFPVEVSDVFFLERAAGELFVELQYVFGCFGVFHDSERVAAVFEQAFVGNGVERILADPIPLKFIGQSLEIKRIQDRRLAAGEGRHPATVIVLVVGIKYHLTPPIVAARLWSPGL